eukprot:jgi/Botrbrau1/3245/Bobra.174_1s0017.1
MQTPNFRLSGFHSAVVVSKGCTLGRWREVCGAWLPTHASRVFNSRFKRRRICYSSADTGSDDSAFQSGLLAATRKVAGLERYRLLLMDDDMDIDILEGAIQIAKHAYPMLDEDWCRSCLDEMASQVVGILGPNRYPLKVMEAVSQHLYEELGYRGAEDDYYNPDNSCINRVLEQRTGIPITLSLVYMQVCQRLGLHMRGVGLPGHFMITPIDPTVNVLVDPFYGGEICFLEDAEHKLLQLHGVQVRVDPAILDEGVTPRMFLYRMLQNLKDIYLNNDETEDLLRVQQYLRATHPSAPDEVRDEGLILYALSRYAESADAIRSYLQLAPFAPDIPRVRDLLKKINLGEEPFV